MQKYAHKKHIILNALAKALISQEAPQNTSLKAHSHPVI